MLLNSGTTSLLSYTRLLLNDESGAANPQWSDAALKAHINRAYLKAKAIGKAYRQGQGLKRTYATGVADQIYYQRPADLTHLEAVEVSGNGSDLSTTAPTSSSVLYAKPWTAEKALEGYNTRYITQVAERCFLGDDHFGIVAPLTATEAGTNSIRILYGASSTELTGDTDEPIMNRDFHDLLCYWAAMRARTSREMDIGELRDEARDLAYEYRIAVQEEMAMYEDDISTVGVREQETPIVGGSVLVDPRRGVDNDVF